MPSIFVVPHTAGRVRATTGRARFSEEQVIGILKTAEAAGNVRLVCPEHNITEQTFYRWRNKYGGLDVSEAGKLKELERENSELKRMVAEQEGTKNSATRLCWTIGLGGSAMTP